MAGDRLDVRYEDNALILKMVGKESIVDEVAGTVDTSPEILERRKRIYICFLCVLRYIGGRNLNGKMLEN